ncbi:RNAse P Rpr2/Rpp21/SNM1 subunit domain-containing protein [Xylaria bambusicola]|uniref:RNAse P Rpr2/Rpp21/SNM1 subunit domain-containing protein n=1 Tax=Xylaria bambusicola TaxID=326684 RepID=UPI002007762A|nr:RNAse P Rpr2/Rpp21/SNM1 subunit domain-containing protein [Xylaria bambusicola]KAI0506158.1 RNAse P Rpr2/Rpp21/SNM1 subunit domain-containing protein [Xylaria bambusicola]
MGKAKTNGSIPNKHLYSRLSYLHQAAAFLGSQLGKTPISHQNAAVSDISKDTSEPLAAQPSPTSDQLRLNFTRHLLTDLRATSLKSQIRLSPAIKHTICKYCDTLLVPGETSTSVVENKSKHGKKPWADVLVVKCNTCGRVTRCPIHTPRQKRRPNRMQASDNIPEHASKKLEPVNKNMDAA